MIRIGLISDTHGLLRPEAKNFLQGCKRIIHGGDIGNTGILEDLASIAPVTAVRGNNDKGGWAELIREREAIEIDTIRIYVIHDLAQLHIDPAKEDIQVVVSGHSHKPLVKEKEGVLYVNPGSAGRRRFKLPVAVGELWLDGAVVRARIVELDIT